MFAQSKVTSPTCRALREPLREPMSMRRCRVRLLLPTATATCEAFRHDKYTLQGYRVPPPREFPAYPCREQSTLPRSRSLLCVDKSRPGAETLGRDAIERNLAASRAEYCNAPSR